MFCALVQTNPKTINYNVLRLLKSPDISYCSLGYCSVGEFHILTAIFSQISVLVLMVDWSNCYIFIGGRPRMNKWSTHVLYMNTSSSSSWKSNRFIWIRCDFSDDMFVNHKLWCVRNRRVDYCHVIYVCAIDLRSFALLTGTMMRCTTYIHAYIRYIFMKSRRKHSTSIHLFA